MRPRRILLIATVLVLGAAPSAGAQVPPLSVDAGSGTRLVIERTPFRLALLDRGGKEAVATVAGTQGPPVRLPGIDGPQPIEPLGAAGAFPPLGFVVGAQGGVTFPVGFFSGNRLFGAEAGAVVSITGVRAATPTPDGLDLDLDTDAPSAGPAHLRVVRLPAGGVKLDLTPPAGLPVQSTMFTLASPQPEALYGLGARKDAFDQRGLLRNVWVEQQNSGAGPLAPVSGADPTGTTGPTYTFPNGPQAAYFVQTDLIGSRGWAAWVANSELSRIDLGASRADAVRWGVAAPSLELSLAGGGIERASASFTASQGRAPAPPRWAYRPWIDVINEGEGEAAPNGAGFSGGPRVRADLEGVVRHAKDDGIPIGVLGVEGWQSVPGAERFFPDLRARGFHLSAYWNPFTAPGNPAYDDALAKGLFIRDGAGNPYPIVTNRGNRSFVIDFTNPAALPYWRDQIARSSRLGFEGFMHDFGEFVTDGMTFHDGTPPAREHNAYPVQYHRAARQAVDAYARDHPGFEPFFYVRSGFTGVTASTPAVFPGDETTDFDRGSGLPSVIPAMLNLALGGGYAFTTDVGGYLDLYTPRTSPELLTRWAQLAAFTPISRIHNSTGKGSLMPWEAGPETLDAYRRYARAKVRLIPLVDRYSRAAAARGAIGPVRPLVLEDDSPAAAHVGDEWLLGRNLLVAPVVAAGARSRTLYLPAGARWERVTVAGDGRLVGDGSDEAGGRTINVPTTLADIPVYRRVLAPRLALHCARGALRARVRGELTGALSASFRAGGRTLRTDSARPFALRARPSRLAGARVLTVSIAVEDGRRLRVARRIPGCARRAVGRRQGAPRYTG